MKGTDYRSFQQARLAAMRAGSETAIRYDEAFLRLISLSHGQSGREDALEHVLRLKNRLIRELYHPIHKETPQS